MSSPPMLALDDTYGALLAGVIIAAVLYGCTCVQTWYYYTHYPKDPWYIKLLVAGVLFSDTCHQALITHVVYTYLVTNFGVFEELGRIVWSLIVEVFFNGFTTLFVQCFLAMRVYKLSNKNLLATGLVMVLVIAQFFMVLVYGSRAVHFTTFIELSTLKNLSMLVNATAAAGDVLIAVFLCSLLQRSRTGFRRSDTMINHLIMFSINTGLLTSFDALASLICTAVWPNTFIYIAFYFSIGRLYCNSLLATLNARKGLRGGSNDEDVSLCQAGTQRVLTNRTKLGTVSKRVPNNISIKVDTTHEYMRDECPLGIDMKSSEVV